MFLSRVNSFVPTYKFTEGLTFFGSVLIVNAVNEFFRSIMGESIQVSVCVSGNRAQGY